MTARVHRARRADLDRIRAETAELMTPDVQQALADRPRTRGDCAGGPRPCPWVGCRHHLALEINAVTGSVKLIREPEAERESCSLDVAERGGLSLEEVGQLTNVTRERVRQIEGIGLRLLKLRMPRW